jgi:hypothetical protein
MSSMELMLVIACQLLEALARSHELDLCLLLERDAIHFGGRELDDPFRRKTEIRFGWRCKSRIHGLAPCGFSCR